MAFVSMKRTPPKKMPGDKEGHCADHGGAPYPYGLELQLGNDELTKLGITEMMDVGTELQMMVKVKVTSASMRDEMRDGKPFKSRNTSMQVTDIDLGASPKAAASKLYGDDD